MKKLISLLLSVIMIFSLVSVGASAADSDELKITVANDLHYNLPYGTLGASDRYNEDYSHVASSNGQLWIESILIVEEFFKMAAQNDSEILLLPGDLTDHGYLEEHAAFSALLKKFETETGKRVYVVPGNHDYYNKKDKVTPADFAEIYKDFGYGEAIATDTASASYVVELNDEYRLLAIDSCIPGSGSAGIDEARNSWITEQAEKAQRDGKKLISMMHHNLIHHFVLGDVLHPGSCVDSKIGLAETYAQYNIRYNFTGHTHSHDVKSYTGKNGVTIYDVLTSSINLYPLPYRTVTFGDKVKIKTEFIESVDMTSKKGVISDNCYDLASTDFPAYALACAHYGLDKVIDTYSQEKQVISLLKLDEEKDAEICAVINRIVPTLRELIDAPIYKKDAPDGNSLEHYAAGLKLNFPETEIYSVRELARFFYQAYVEGDENYGILSNEYRLFISCVTVLLNYVLKDVSADDYALALSFICNYLGADKIPDFFLSFAADGISRAKGIDIVVSTVISSAFLTFSTDEAPADNNATLPGYAETAPVEEELTFFDKIVRFFLSVFDVILRFFGVG